MTIFVDWRSPIVSDERVDAVEVRSVVPQIVLVPIWRPQDTKMLHFIVDSTNTNKQQLNKTKYE